MLAQPHGKPRGSGSPMAMYDAALVKQEEIAEGTRAFYFEKPAGFAFKAGQFIELTLPGISEPDAGGNTRPFTLASAPEEELLMVATRMRQSAFKRALGALPLGSKAKIEGPFGSFTLHNDAKKPAVFLMGGIGITPARSIAVHAARAKLPHRIFLFYSNRRPEDAAFLEEFFLLEKENPNFRFIPTMTDKEYGAHAGEGERGYITAEMVKKYLSDIHAPIFYSAGPQAMVAAMREMLNRAGVDDDFIRAEEFSGY
ncbi:MAG: FAD-dependent oxidoreductase [Patescibacteria group bacterium]